MALTKSVEVDKIEIVGEFKAVQVRTATVVSEDGTELSRSYHRHVIQAGGAYLIEDAEVQAVCAAVQPMLLSLTVPPPLLIRRQSNGNLDYRKLGT